MIPITKSPLKIAASGNKAALTRYIKSIVVSLRPEEVTGAFDYAKRILEGNPKVKKTQQFHYWKGYEPFLYLIMETIYDSFDEESQVDLAPTMESLRSFDGKEIKVPDWLSDESVIKSLQAALIRKDKAFYGDKFDVSPYFMKHGIVDLRKLEKSESTDLADITFPLATKLQCRYVYPNGKACHYPTSHPGGYCMPHYQSMRPTKHCIATSTEGDECSFARAEGYKVCKQHLRKLENGEMIFKLLTIHSVANRKDGSQVKREVSPSPTRAKNTQTRVFEKSTPKSTPKPVPAEKPTPKPVPAAKAKATKAAKPKAKPKEEEEEEEEVLFTPKATTPKKHVTVSNLTLKSMPVQSSAQAKKPGISLNTNASQVLAESKIEEARRKEEEFEEEEGVEEEIPEEVAEDEGEEEEEVEEVEEEETDEFNPRAPSKKQ